MPDNINYNNGKSTREMVVELTVSAAVQENKLDTVITTLKAHDKWYKDIDLRVRTVETEQGRQKESLKNAIRNVTGFNAVYATVAAIVAGIFGKGS